MSAPDTSSSGDRALAPTGSGDSLARRLRFGRGPRAALAAFGVFLLILAVWWTLSSATAVRQAEEAIARLRWWHITVACAIPVANFFLTAAIFWILTERSLPGIKLRPGEPTPKGITYREMLALITSGTLLNQLPAKPGIIGRVVYHKVITLIPIRTTVVVMLQAVGAGGLGVFMLITCGTLWAAFGPIAGAAPLVPILIWAALSLRRARRSGVRHLGLPMAAGLCVAIRLIETAGWAVRYWILLDVAGRPIDFSLAVIIAGASQLAILLPVQVGLREWTVGAVLALLGPAITTGGDPNAASAQTLELARPGLLADLLCRGADLSVMIPAGLLASWFVYRRIKAASGAAQVTAP